ncbi:hypothetical protein AGABI1DRAFT_37519 [Agaricus bisporus var. burnettii JB137-S8]|uniref:Bola-like protein n=2 Tax=Agaricus bisporus var. burnettii TaxID=192524 RepID=K5W1Q3_AGABU|nr:hypothetical protein AGABI2DRAFT_70068 [Agaricus bisporus var. bisporus H97]XP_007328022.1 uncharacterized protein AGABI1DRAFT_37519 [Agaricus bisporus var. burnettii JB137-S8]EKM80719.1 hypothetical protein AGABI1DRAFT_37519 [Agaricus bisporus var. burnettii JB137-S8]EKV47187.1 hypothetical protein AGABI2DRAFT_70068 [Agaricus bisporus var. bisporus H97]KAF7783036.1 hypothetical protein Agabi119p4_2412 [Agaricus bisporus var. burnettii]
MSSNLTSTGTVEKSMREKLTALLHPISLTIRNESSAHRHHAAMRAQNGGSGETHFSIRVVSDAFKGKSPIQRHRMINTALSEEFMNGLHALTLEAKTGEEAARTSP